MESDPKTRWLLTLTWSGEEREQHLVDLTTQEYTLLELDLDDDPRIISYSLVEIPYVLNDTAIRRQLGLKSDISDTTTAS